MTKCDFNKVAKQSNFIEIALRHVCSPVNFLHSFRAPFPRNNSGRLPLCILIHVYSPMDFINESVTFFLIHVAWCFVFPLLFVHGANKNCFIMAVPHDFLL